MRPHGRAPVVGTRSIRARSPLYVGAGRHRRQHPGPALSVRTKVPHRSLKAMSVLDRRKGRAAAAYRSDHASVASDRDARRLPAQMTMAGVRSGSNPDRWIKSNDVRFCVLMDPELTDCFRPADSISRPSLPPRYPNRLPESGRGTGMLCLPRRVESRRSQCSVELRAGNYKDALLVGTPILRQLCEGRPPCRNS